MKTEQEKNQTTAEINGKEQISGAEAILQCLIAEGVDTVFGYPGGAIMPIYDKLMDYEDKIRHILTRHEQGAAHAAQAYSMVTGRTGICFATSGPGATNLVTGIANAFLDSVPVVFITAQVVSGLIEKNTGDTRRYCQGILYR
jgi:acetolactate synthase-1/2/3 large subunit